MSWVKRVRTLYYKIAFALIILTMGWYLMVSFYSPHLTILAKLIIDPKVNEEQMITSTIEKIYNNEPILQKNNILNSSNIEDIQIKYYNASGSGNNFVHNELNLIIIFELINYIVEVENPKIESEVLLWKNNFVSFTIPDVPEHLLK